MYLAIYAQGAPQKRVCVRKFCVCQLLLSDYIQNADVSVNSVPLPHTKFGENPYSSLYKDRDIYRTVYFSLRTNQNSYF
jgi:hypothetical protein